MVHGKLPCYEVMPLDHAKTTSINIILVSCPLFIDLIRVVMYLGNEIHGLVMRFVVFILNNSEDDRKQVYSIIIIEQLGPHCKRGDLYYGIYILCGACAWELL